MINIVYILAIICVSGFVALILSPLLYLWKEYKELKKEARD